VILLVGLPSIGTLPAFVAAIVAALVIQGASLRVLRDSLTPGVREAVVNESVP
jgi:hypothetical protein